jgi:WD40 repeat protein
LFPYQDFAAWIFNQVEHPEFLYFKDAITSLAISPDGGIAAFGAAIANQIVDRDYQAKIFLFNPTDLQTDAGTTAFRNVLDGHQGMVTSLAFSPDGRVLVSSGYDRFIKFWDVGTGRLLGQASTTDTPNFLTYSRDGSRLAVASNLEVIFVNPESMQVEQSIPLSSGDNLAFSPDGNFVYVSTPFNIRVIDSDAGAVLLEFPDTSALVPTTTVAEDGTILGVTYQTPDKVDNFALSPDGVQIVTYTVAQSLNNGSENVRLAVWDAKTGKYLSETKFVGNFVEAIEVSPDGDLLAVGNNHEVWLWETASWHIAHKFSGHIDLVEELAFTSDGTKFLSAGRDGTVRVWSLEQ